MPRFHPAQNSFVAGEVSPRLEGRAGLPQFQQSMRIAENGIVLPHGGFTRRPGTAFAGEVKESANFTRVLPFQFNVEQAYVFEFGNIYMRVFVNQGRLVDGMMDPFEVVTPWTTAMLPSLQTAQSNDILFVTTDQIHPYQVNRTDPSTFTVTKMTFTVPPVRAKNIDDGKTVAISSSGTVATFVGFTLDDTNNFDDGRVVMVVSGNNHEYYTIQSVNGGGATAVITKLIRVDATGISAADPLDTIAATDDFHLGFFSDNEGASAVVFHEGRLGFGGSQVEPDRYVLSNSDDFFNFSIPNPGNDDAGNSDRSISRRIVGQQQNSIRWMASTDTRLFIGGAGQEFEVVGAGGDILTPSSVATRPLTNRGSALNEPVIVDSQVIFVSGRKMRELIFDERNSGFRARDITILAEHILNEGIDEVVYQQDPDSIIWVVRSDGQLVGFTFEREQEVIGAHRHIIGGSFGSGNAVVESITVIPTPDLNEDQVWLVVKRTINGATKRYVEYIDKSYRPNVDATSSQADLIAAVAEGRFADSFIFSSGIVGTTISGLDHVIGQTVKILSNGAVHPDRVVNGSGEIELVAVPANGEVVIGLRELTRGMTQRFLPSDTDFGSGLGLKHRIQRVAFMLYNTLGMRFGASGATQLDEIEFRGGSDPMDQSPPLLHSGFVEQAMPSEGAGWTTDPVVYFEQDQPLPLTILAIAPFVETETRG